MESTRRRRIASSVVPPLVASLCGLGWLAWWATTESPTARAQPPVADAPVADLPEPGAPAATAGKLAGLTKCAACHFRQYKDWQTTPHGNAFKILPAKYRDQAECLECHSSHRAEAATLAAAATPAHELGVSCESCHGPGDDHAKYALSFVGRERLFTEDEVKLLRSKIQRLALDQCVKCHTAQAHKPHPPYDREQVDAGQPLDLQPADKRRFFEGHAPQLRGASDSR